MAQELILIRGLPGSGKSTLARWILDHAPAYPEEASEHWYHSEADMFFNGVDEKYCWRPEMIKDAHKWCQDSTRKTLQGGHSIVVSNTFSRIWEMQPYIDMAHEFGVKITVLTCEGNYGNVHNVPDEVVQKMKERWERYV